MRFCAMLVAICLDSATLAKEGQEYWSNEGDKYFGVTNKSGAVLTLHIPSHGSMANLRVTSGFTPTPL